jgi:hypothetical protein
MQPRDHYTEARRWAKFPATVLLATGLLWLLENYFTLNLRQIGELTETGVGMAYALLDLLLIPLGSVAVGIFLLFTQRWAIVSAVPLTFAALLIITFEKVQRYADKVSQYRTTQETAAYGDAVMTILLIIALWALFALLVLYLAKTWKHLNAAQEWLARPAREPQPALAAAHTPASNLTLPEDDMCLLLPDCEDPEAEEANP